MIWGYLTSAYQLLEMAINRNQEASSWELGRSTRVFISVKKGVFDMQATSYAPHGATALLSIGQKVYLRLTSYPKETTDVSTDHCATESGLYCIWDTLVNDCWIDFSNTVHIVVEFSFLQLIIIVLDCYCVIQLFLNFTRTILKNGVNDEFGHQQRLIRSPTIDGRIILHS